MSVSNLAATFSLLLIIVGAEHAYLVCFPDKIFWLLFSFFDTDGVMPWLWELTLLSYMWWDISL